MDSIIPLNGTPLIPSNHYRCCTIQPYKDCNDCGSCRRNIPSPYHPITYQAYCIKRKYLSCNGCGNCFSPFDLFGREF